MGRGPRLKRKDVAEFFGLLRSGYLNVTSPIALSLAVLGCMEALALRDPLASVDVFTVGSCWQHALSPWANYADEVVFNLSAGATLELLLGVPEWTTARCKVKRQRLPHDRIRTSYLYRSTTPESARASCGLLYAVMGCEPTQHDSLTYTLILAAPPSEDLIEKWLWRAMLEEDGLWL